MIHGQKLICRSQKTTAYAVAAWVIVLLGGSHIRAEVRVGLIAEGPAASEGLSAAYAKLSKASNINLVEREELQNAVDGQIFAGTGGIDAQRAMAIGTAVRVNLLAIIGSGEAQNGEAASLDIVAFDASTGERLTDIPLPENRGEPLAEAIAVGVRSAVAKQAMARKDRRAICLLSSRNVDLPGSANGFCDAVGALLQRRLLNSPSVAILERERLGVLNQERDLDGHAGSVDASLAPSMITIELDIAKEGAMEFKEVLATASLKDIHQHEVGIARAKGSREDVGALASVLASEVLKSLSLAPATQPSPADARSEAARFERESRLRVAHHDWREAANAADAAYAFAPDRPPLRILLARTLTMYAISIVSPHIDEDSLVTLPESRLPADMNLDTTLQLLHRATSELLVAGQVPGGRRQLAGAVKILHQFVVAILEDQEGRLTRANNDGTFDPPQWRLSAEQRKELTVIIRDYRRYTVEVDEPLARAAVCDEASFVDYSAILLGILGDECHIFAGTSNVYTADYAKRIPEWAKLSATYATQSVKVYGPVEELTETAIWGWCTVNHDWMSRWRPACFDRMDATDGANWDQAVKAIKQAGPPERLYINLRPWVERVASQDARDPAVVTVIPKEAVFVAVPKPQETEPPAALSLLFSKEVTLLNVSAPDSDLVVLNKPDPPSVAIVIA